jgi:hypothetical protein
MNRETLINRLVDRKLASATNNRARCLCVCLARKSVGGRRAAPSGSKR